MTADARAEAGYDDEMAVIADGYHTLLLSIADRSAWYIEARLTSPFIHRDVWGTADALAVIGPTLIVVDLKTGMVPVEAVDNEQLACYMSLAAARHAEKRRANTLYRLSTQVVTRVTGIIHQPRAGGTKRWHVPVPELRQWRGALTAGAIAASDTGAKAVPGDHCLYCPAAGACAAHAAHRLAALHMPVTQDRNQDHHQEHT